MISSKTSPITTPPTPGLEQQRCHGLLVSDHSARVAAASSVCVDCRRSGEVTMGDRVTVGTLDELRRDGCLTGKVGSRPVCVFWSEGAAYALDDRCPHMGFPLHRGSVESGLLTCHWHNARFDVSSGGTLDPWADDVRSYPVEIEDDRVTVIVEPDRDRTGYL